MDDAGTDPQRQASTSLPPTTQAAAAARDFVANRLRGWAVEAAILRDVVLVTSELVTNAVEHGTGEIRVELLQHADRMRLRVWDASPEPPLRKQTTLLSARNRGLTIVDALSADVGHQYMTGGKWVWADFAVIAATGTARPADDAAELGSI